MIFKILFIPSLIKKIKNDRELRFNLLRLLLLLLLLHILLLIFNLIYCEIVKLLFFLNFCRMCNDHIILNVKFTHR